MRCLANKKNSSVSSTCSCCEAALSDVLAAEKDERISFKELHLSHWVQWNTNEEQWSQLASTFSMISYKRLSCTNDDVDARLKDCAEKQTNNRAHIVTPCIHGSNTKIGNFGRMLCAYTSAEAFLLSCVPRPWRTEFGFAEREGGECLCLMEKGDFRMDGM